MQRHWWVRIAAAVHSAMRTAVYTAAALATLTVGGAMTAPLGAQPRVVVETSDGVVLSTVSPRFVIRSLGFGAVRPLRITMRVSENFGVQPPFLVDTTFITNDTVRVLNVQNALPSGATVYWTALVEAGTTAAISDVTGPRVVPNWVEMLDPASRGGDRLDTRQPRFLWRSPAVSAAAGPFRYDFEVTTTNEIRTSTVFAASNIADTSFVLPVALQANTSYRWRLVAFLPGQPQRIVVESPGSFVIIDPPLPTATIIYQNFPNPFPSPASPVGTCFWFDVGEPGATISLEILDLRGNPVFTVIPAADGQTLFPAGRYGRGTPGSGSNCDNRFVWEGLTNNGQLVPPGVYLARFRANGGAPVVRRILFRGR